MRVCINNLIVHDPTGNGEKRNNDNL